uniref:Uncharacterized protein n=1 Tax=Timema tahoe TaxID=61484 RepID=A0A7R9FFG3_9NEOP|nr:unnamed protein product [Timema tahoe]
MRRSPLPALVLALTLQVTSAAVISRPRVGEDVSCGQLNVAVVVSSLVSDRQARFLEVSWDNASPLSGDWVGLFNHDPSSGSPTGPLFAVSVNTSSGWAYTGTRTDDVMTPGPLDFTSRCLGAWAAYVKADNTTVLTSNCLRDQSKPPLNLQSCSILYVTVVSVTRTRPTWLSDMKSSLSSLRMNDIFLPGSHDAGSYQEYSGIETLVTKYTITQVAAVTQLHRALCSDYIIHTSYDYCIPMASLVLTDSSQLTADGFEKLPDQIMYPYAEPYDLQKTCEEDVLSQLIYGIRYLDLRVGYYPTRDPVWWVNHGVARLHPLQEFIDDVKTFIQATDEIVILDAHEFPQGFGSDLTVHQLLETYLREQLGALTVPKSLSWSSTLGEVWSSGKRLILSYNQQQLVASSDLLWTGVSQQWGNVDTLDGLYNYLAGVMNNPPTNVGWSAMAELTPNAWQVITDSLGGLRKMADTVNRNVTAWYKGTWGKTVNIVAVDFFKGTAIVDAAIDWNDRRAKQSSCSSVQKSKTGA